MIDPASIHEKKIAMLVWKVLDNGDDDVAIMSGIAEWDGVDLKIINKSRSDFYTIIPTTCLVSDR